MKKRFAATLLGCALGDTLGMAVEGWKKEQIEKYVGRVTEPIAPVLVKDEKGNLVKNDGFGRLKYYGRDLEKGDYTDDTIFTLAIAESIAEKKTLDLEDIAQRQLKEYMARVKEDGSPPAGFGRTTVMGMANLQKGILPINSGVIGGPGNAPAMKMSPLGLYMYATKKYVQGLGFAELIGKITHLDPRSVASGIVQAYATYALLQDIPKDDFVNSINKLCAEYERPLNENFMIHSEGSLASRLDWIARNKDAAVEDAFCRLKNSSKVYESYPFTLFMFQKYWDSPIEGLIDTVNYGGDCDTTGAIYGALCGAKNGMIFPEDWVEVIKDNEQIKNTAEKIWRLK